MLAGVLAVVVLSIGTDAVLHATGVFPPLGQRMADALFLLATAYRTVYGVGKLREMQLPARGGG